MTAAVLAIGTLLQKQNPVSLSWATISEVRSIQGPDFSTDEKDVTNHGSANRTRERLGTLNDPGMLSFDINYIPSDPTQDEITGILYDKLNFTRPSFRLVLPDAGSKTLTFPGFVKDFKMKAPVDDVLTAAVVIRIISAPVITGT